MQLDRYEVQIDESLTTFDFISEGRLGKIEKAIKYERLDENVYNLGFGDKNLITGEIDDTVVSNNGDIEKVLATVSVSIYSQKYIQKR